MADDSDTSSKKVKKDKSAVEGNAPGGPDFSSANGPMASGDSAVLGGQVQAETQTREDDGGRTLALPVKDPGPVLADGVKYRHPDISKGETIGSVNEGHDVLTRHSTAPDWAGKPGHNVMITKMSPDVSGMHSLASDVYNKEKGEGLTDVAKKLTTQPRVLAPTVDTPEDAKETADA